MSTEDEKRTFEERQSAFVAGLFRDGYFTFDQERDHVTEYESLNRRVARYETFRGRWSDDHVDEKIRDARDYAEHILTWKEEVSDKVPKSWGDSVEYIDRDIRSADGLGIRLPNDLLDASVLYPGKKSAEAVGTLQKLTLKQLFVLLTNPYTFGDSLIYGEIISAQRRIGVDDEAKFHDVLGRANGIRSRGGSR